MTIMYILVNVWTVNEEVSVNEFESMKDLKEYVKNNRYLLDSYKFYIAKVLATKDYVLDNLKEDDNNE